MRSAPALIVALCAASTTGGCTALAVAGVAGATVLVAKDRTLGEGVDETTGGTEIRAKLLGADFSAFSRISVEVSQGRVLLAGAVPTMEHKLEAERIAWSSPSVKKVENTLDIGPRADFWRASWDALITTEVRTRFLADDDVKSINFNIETHRGVVYLMGVARQELELRRAVEIARRVGGVERVVSFIEVRSRAPQIEPTDGLQTATGYAPYSDDPMGESAVTSESIPGRAQSPAILAPPQSSPAPARASGRRMEVRYPDEQDSRSIDNDPLAAGTGEGAATMPAQADPAPVSDGARTGISGFGRSWSTPRQGPSGAPLLVAPAQGLRR